jgi:hypothetical protein
MELQARHCCDSRVIQEVYGWGLRTVKKLFFFFSAELGLVEGCLYLVGVYWAGFGFSTGWDFM